MVAAAAVAIAPAGAGMRARGPIAQPLSVFFVDGRITCASPLLVCVSGFYY